MKINLKGMSRKELEKLQREIEIEIEIKRKQSARARTCARAHWHIRLITVTHAKTIHLLILEFLEISLKNGI